MVGEFIKNILHHIEHRLTQFRHLWTNRLIEVTHKIMGHSKKSKISMSGFSLLELSIALVIIGLLAGGTLAGRSLIRASELRAIATEAANFQSAVLVFEDRYNALPGDMADATNIWGRADDGSFSGQCSDPLSDTGTGKLTCNGDGDGIIMPRTNEVFRGWEHLSNAGMISGNYTGIGGSNDPEWQHIVGESCPASKITGAGWSLFHGDTAAGWANSDWFHIPTDDRLLLEIGREEAFWEPTGSIMTTEEALSIDTKTDDGRPGQGKIVTQKPPGYPCATTAVEATAQYNITNTNISCMLIFVIR